MKKFVMVLLASCLGVGAYAQFGKGTMMVGGSFGAILKQTKVSTTEIRIPMVNTLMYHSILNSASSLSTIWR
jgi:hypothetical protein